VGTVWLAQANFPVHAPMRWAAFGWISNPAPLMDGPKATCGAYTFRRNLVITRSPILRICIRSWVQFFTNHISTMHLLAAQQTTLPAAVTLRPPDRHNFADNAPTNLAYFKNNVYILSRREPTRSTCRVSAAYSQSGGDTRKTRKSAQDLYYGCTW